MAEKDFYTYRVTFSLEDDEYLGLCAEFPSLSWLSPDPEGALRGIRKLVAEVVEDMKANNESTPEPIATTHYSGKFGVRIPPSQHRELVLEAREAGISLNRLVSSKLSR